MALYKHQDYLTHSNDNAFDNTHNPGAVVPFSGIYKCMNCHKEVASNQGQPLPPQNHSQHSPVYGAIVWKLIVYADHNPKR
jgi:hypothetical protein